MERKAMILMLCMAATAAYAQTDGAGHSHKLCRLTTYGQHHPRPARGDGQRRATYREGGGQQADLRYATAA